MAVTTEEVVAAIEAGDLDGHLDELVRAAVGRARDGAVEMVWRCRYDGEEWDAKSVTLGELIYAQRRAGAAGMDGSYRRDLMPTVSTGDALALLVAHLHKARGMSEQEALDRVGKVTAGELAEVVDEYELVRPGKGGPGSGPESTS
jgi:hypothetical protein